MREQNAPTGHSTGPKVSSSFRHSLESQYSFHPMYSKMMQQKAVADLRGDLASMANNANTLSGSSVIESSEKVRFNALDINDALHRISNIKGGSVSSIDHAEQLASNQRQMTERAHHRPNFQQQTHPENNFAKKLVSEGSQLHP